MSADIVCLASIEGMEKNSYNLTPSTQRPNDMLDRLVKIMKSYLNVKFVIEHIDRFFMDFTTKEMLLNYFDSNWVASHKLCKFTYYSFFFGFCSL